MYSAVSLVEVYTVYTYTMRFTSWYTVVVPNFSIARIVRKFVCSRKVILIFMPVSLARFWRVHTTPEGTTVNWC